MASDFLADQCGAEWIRIPLGSDCGEAMMQKANLLKENVERSEKVWRSTDVVPERLGGST